MEPEGSLPYLQQPATGPYPEPDTPAHIFPPYFSDIYSNSILPSTIMSSAWSLSFRSTDQNIIRISHLSHACYLVCPSHPP